MNTALVIFNFSLNFYIALSQYIPIQKELSKKLSEGEKLQTLADWKMLQEVDVKTIETDRRLDKLLAEIEVTAGESAQPFLARATLIGQESSSSRRSLLTDKA